MITNGLNEYYSIYIMSKSQKVILEIYREAFFFWKVTLCDPTERVWNHLALGQACAPV